MGVLRVGVCLYLALASLAAQRPVTVRVVTWDDMAAVRPALVKRGITPAAFADYVQRARQANARRVREGDLDHLIFYMLQSTRFTKLPPIEPALSAKAYVDSGNIPPPVTARTRAFLRAAGRDARLSYFREIADAALPEGAQREEGLLREYGRVMRFIHEKEFVAQKSERPQAAVAELYRTRGLSTDTAVEAGFLVSEGLAVLRAVEPSLRIRRVLIVGPGLDLAPRTGLLDARAPESYQPWAVLDALLALGFSKTGDLDVACVDINPRVVRHIRRAAARPPVLTFISEIRESEAVSLSNEFKAYVAALGNHLGPVEATNAVPAMPAGHVSKVVRTRPAVARVLEAHELDIVTQRIEPASFDLVIATNILPYFDDVELAMALTNIASMLAPKGFFLHNEARPFLMEQAIALGLPLEQARQTIVATVRGGPPLMDSVFIHRKAGE